MSASMQKELSTKTYSMVDLIYSSSGFTDIRRLIVNIHYLSDSAVCSHNKRLLVL